jgi:hypothetical protein
MYFNHNFFSSIRLWWRWKVKKKRNKYARNRFFLIQTFTIPKRPAIKNHKSVRIWNPFPTWIVILEKEKTCTYSIWTRRRIYDFSRIPRVSRASLIPINRALTFEEKTHKLGRKNWRLLQEEFWFFFLPLFIFCMHIILVYISCN